MSSAGRSRCSTGRENRLWSNGGEASVRTLHEGLVRHLRKRGHLRSRRVEAAFRAVPRHLFLPDVEPDRAYADEAVAVKQLESQVVSSSSEPSMMAIMLEQLDLQPGQRVLEVGAGTGYNAALLAHIVGERGHVVTVDLDKDLVEAARRNLAVAGFEGVEVIHGDGAHGHEEGAPYDRIILTTAAWDIAPAWHKQLGPEGWLLMPLAIRSVYQKSVLFGRVADHLVSKSLSECGFMMMRGAFAGPTRTLSIGPVKGLYLVVDDADAIDQDAAYELLMGPSTDISSKVWVTRGEVWAGLSLWLAIREPSFCRLRADGQVADKGIVPCLFSYSGEWKTCFTGALASKHGLCALAQAFDSPLLPESSQQVEPFELLVRSYGTDDKLALKMIDEIRAWDDAGRPSTDGLHIRAYPRGEYEMPSRAEYLISKESTELVCDWFQE